MSLDNIQLSTLAVNEWYKDALLPHPDGAAAFQRPVPAPSPVAPAPTAAAAAAAPRIAEKPAAPPTEPGPAPQPAAEPKPLSSLAAEQKPAEQKPAPPPAPADPGAYKFLGNNRKKVTILVQSPGIPFLPDNQLTFLTKILEACRMNIGDVAIVNTATAPVTIAALKQQLAPAAILLFGLEPTAIKLPINFPVFKVQPYDDCNYLSAPPLTQLVQQTEESKLLKSKLWVCLKTLFDV